MTVNKHVPPEYWKSSFNCPLCDAFSEQRWGYASLNANRSYSGVENVTFSRCSHCQSESIWVGKLLVYPEKIVAPIPNEDLPDDVREDYMEARTIIHKSPRGAAALLRLAIQKLCRFLGESGKNINNDIAELVKKGLNPNVQKSLDIVRVIGNEAVHPGIIDLKDSPEIAIKLCTIINIIADLMITQPKLIEQMYSGLPEDKVKGIESRDK
jgi:hypothetical protein